MAHELTQQQLAERIGTSYSAISRIESGRTATSLQTLIRIAHALDLKLVLGFEEAFEPAEQGKKQRRRSPKRDLIAV